MKDEAKTWLDYSKENLESAKVLLSSNLFNPCLQNVQQSVEKALKAVQIQISAPLKKTHDILGLKTTLENSNVFIDLTGDECDFLNTIYLPSKYPIGSALPDYEPGIEICNEAIAIADKVLKSVQEFFNKKS